MTESEAAIRRILAQVYDAGRQGGGKPGKRDQVLDWASTALAALVKPAGEGEADG